MPDEAVEQSRLITGNRLVLSQDEVDAIKDRRLRLDCMQITLTQRAETAYSGSGSLRQNSDGTLSLTLWDPVRVLSPQSFMSLGESEGSWIGREEAIHLDAVDLVGRRWHSDSVDVSLTGRAFEPGIVVRGQLRRLSCKGPANRQTGTVVDLYFPNRIEILTNAGTRTESADGTLPVLDSNVWIVPLSRGSLTAIRLANGLGVRFTSSESGLPEVVADRVEDALSFAVGERLGWTMAQVQAPSGIQIEIRGERAVTGQPRIGPPIKTGHVEAVEDAGRLLDRFLETVMKHPDPLTRHPLAVSVLKVLKASALGIDYEVLSLSVEVEALVREYFHESGEPPIDVKNAVNDALAYIEKWSGPEDVRNRLRDCARLLKSTNPKNALHKLLASGVIEKSHLDAWERLRHRAAHGRRLSGTIRDIVADCNQVHQLLLLLVFSVVGYAGRFTDYTQVGYPLRDTPA